MFEISFERRKKRRWGLGIPEQDDESFSIQRLEQQKLPSIFYHNSQQKMNEEKSKRSKIYADKADSLLLKCRQF